MPSKTDFIVEAILIFPDGAQVDGDVLLRRAAQAIGMTDGAPWQPRNDRVERFLAGEQGAVRITLAHPCFATANSWVALSRTCDRAENIAIIGLGVHLDTVDQLDIEWRLALAIVPRIVASVRPMLAFIGMRDVDAERSALPSEDSYRRPGLPREWTPWTFVGPERLDAAAEVALAGLPFVGRDPLAGGWALRLTEGAADNPSDELIAAMRCLDPAIRYRGSVLRLGED